MQSFSRATRACTTRRNSRAASPRQPAAERTPSGHVLKSRRASRPSLAVALRDGGFGDARVDESLHHYTVGLRLRPDVPGGQYNYAQALYGIGRKDEAASRLRLTLLAPAMHLAYDALADAIQGATSAAPSRRSARR